MELRVSYACRAGSLAPILLYDHQHSRAGHRSIIYDVTQCQKRDGVRYQNKCVAETLYYNVRIAVSVGETVPHDGSLQFFGICTA